MGKGAVVQGNLLCSGRKGGLIVSLPTRTLVGEWSRDSGGALKSQAVSFLVLRCEQIQSGQRAAEVRSAT